MKKARKNEPRELKEEEANPQGVSDVIKTGSFSSSPIFEATAFASSRAKKRPERTRYHVPPDGTVTEDIEDG
jgi:hypothetical protein